jgi:hypothetical protein
LVARRRKRKKPSPPTAAELRQVFEVHLPYEIVRLVEMYRLLLEPNPYRSDLKPEVAETVDDALIVGFCTHARNLLESFFRSRKFQYALATDYANAPPYVRLDPKREDVDRLYGQLCAQINHLTYGRTDDNSKKIDVAERKELIDIVNEETTRLGKHLKSDYDKQHLHLDILAAAAAMEVKVGGAVGASPEPSFIKSPMPPVTHTASIDGDFFRVTTQKNS